MSPEEYARKYPVFLQFCSCSRPWKRLKALHMSYMDTHVHFTSSSMSEGCSALPKCLNLGAC